MADAGLQPSPSLPHLGVGQFWSEVSFVHLAVGRGVGVGVGVGVGAGVDAAATVPTVVVAVTVLAMLTVAAVALVAVLVSCIFVGVSDDVGLDGMRGGRLWC